ncbi:MAG: Dam family site-specific DNA-(adenine-N6)-methyltransferase [Blastochloris sp.]|nr:Dam family site-specific DNA-(adenine-N6)-methyltransferase [Blastochloris sp.]
MKPFFRWAGSKASLVDAIASRLPGLIDTYYEPFAGSAALFLHLAEEGRIRRAVLGDGSPAVAATLEAVRDDPHGVTAGLADVNRELNRVRQTVYKAQAYYQLCARNLIRRQEPARTAALFLFLNQTCFNGLWRTNREGLLNTPPDLARVAAWRPDPDPIKHASRLLKTTNAEIRHADFSRTLGVALGSEGQRNQSVVYLDPPYLPETASGFKSYTSEGFRPSDFADLMELVAQLTLRHHRVVLSTSIHPLAMSTIWSLAETGRLPGANVETLSTRRRIAASPERRGNRDELLMVAGGR